ncbi:MAG TPA: hypothetical protein PLC79_12570 [Phycisphaerae bacterium]|nr:hypothetical protein [Phycisphaerae bacterium]
MQRRLLWSLRAFQISLTVLLVAGVLAATAWRYERADLARLCDGAILGAAVLAATARFWRWRLQRKFRPTTFPTGPGYYGVDSLFDQRFLAR